MCSTAPHPSQTRMTSSWRRAASKNPPVSMSSSTGSGRGGVSIMSVLTPPSSMRALPGGSAVDVTRHTSAPGTCDVDSPADLADAFDDVVHAVDVALREVAAAGVDRDAATEVDLAAGDERSALALGAEPPVLELHEDGDREAVVHLGDVDVLRAEPGSGVERLGHRLRRQLGDAVTHQHRELDAGLRVRDAVLGDGPDEHRFLAQVSGPIGARDDDRARAVGLEAEVVEPQRSGDHPGRQVVVHRQRAVVHLCTGIGVRPLPARQRDLAELLVGRPVLEHVALRHQGEDLARREQPVRREELVVACRRRRPAPRSASRARSAALSGRSARGTRARWSPARTGSPRPPGRPARTGPRRPARPRPST